jgi:hypothetical protein
MGHRRWVVNNNLRKAIYVLASVIALYGLTFNFPSSGLTGGATHAARTSPKAPNPEPTPLPPDAEVMVTETGDPGAPGESFVVDLRAMNDALKESPTLAAFPREQRQYVNAKRVAEGMLGYALDLADRNPPVTRQTNPRQIQRFTGLFNYRSEHVPFCAMGVAYAAIKAYCDLTPGKITYSRGNETRTFKALLPIINEYYFPPSASCLFMMNEAKKRRSSQRGGWVAKGRRLPRRGWLVLFDWNNRGDGVPDHVGIVRGLGGRNLKRLYTVEFNTSVMSGSQRNGGAVARKVRSMDDVLGFIRTY